MKRTILLLSSWMLFAQLPAQGPLQISTHKTTSLIFPFPVLHVDHGTKDILVQHLKEQDNILLVKAAVAKFAEANLSGVTRDGCVYSFKVM